jgi:hypothetical protein
MKKLKYKIRAGIVRFLLRLCNLLKGHCYCRNEFYYEAAKIRIKDLKNKYKPNKFEGLTLTQLKAEKFYPPNYENRSWAGLLKDIEENGLKSNPIVIKSKYGYEIWDGNHRLKVLEYLYGEDHKVLVDIYLIHDNYVPYYPFIGIEDVQHYGLVLAKQKINESKRKIYEA